MTKLNQVKCFCGECDLGKAEALRDRSWKILPIFGVFERMPLLFWASAIAIGNTATIAGHS